MGISKMQGVSAHIEYLKRDYENIDFINCKFWKNEICYNTLSTKYGEGCYSKRGCMYSIPLPKGTKKKTNNYVKGKVKGNSNINAVSLTYTCKPSDIKRKYFNKDIVTTVKIGEKSYRVKYKYNSVNGNLILLTKYVTSKRNYDINLSIDFTKGLRVSGNEAIFTINIDDIIKAISNTKYIKVSEVVKENNKSNIIRKAIISDDNDVRNKIDSLLKFTAYIVIKGFMEIY